MKADFLEDLKTIMKRHGMYLSGTVRLINGKDDKWDVDTFQCSITQSRKLYGGIDNTGPFLTASIEQKPEPVVEIKASHRFQISPDYQGYDCPVTGKWIEGRAAHRENLKVRGCRNLEPGESRDSQKYRERALDEGCRRTAHEMVASIAHQIEI